MANPVCEVLLTEATLKRSHPASDGSGAVVDFFGVVRPLEADSEISGIQYEAHPAMATHQMEQIAGAAIERFGLNSAVIHHRVGFVAVGEASVFVRTSSRNRAESYKASGWIMEQLKKRVPIWKQPKLKSVEQPNPTVVDVVSRR